MFWRRRKRDEEDPFAALRGDGTVSLPGMDERPLAGPAPAPVRSPRLPDGRVTGRIRSRRETGVVVSGVPRLVLQIEVRGEDGVPVVVEHRAVPPAGSASAVGDEVEVDLDGRGGVRAVVFRPEIRR